MQRYAFTGVIDKILSMRPDGCGSRRSRMLPIWLVLRKARDRSTRLRIPHERGIGSLCALQRSR
jgi:hypothetical protein